MKTFKLILLSVSEAVWWSLTILDRLHSPLTADDAAAAAPGDWGPSEGGQGVHWSCCQHHPALINRGLKNMSTSSCIHSVNATQRIRQLDIWTSWAGSQMQLPFIVHTSDILCKYPWHWPCLMHCDQAPLCPRRPSQSQSSGWWSMRPRSGCWTPDSGWACDLAPAPPTQTCK